MMLVVIYEESHGTIGIARNANVAINWLIDNGWLDENYELYDDDKEDYVPLYQKYDILNVRNWGMRQFNDVFEGRFYLAFQELIE